MSHLSVIRNRRIGSFNQLIRLRKKEVRYCWMVLSLYILLNLMAIILHLLLLKSNNIILLIKKRSLGLSCVLYVNLHWIQLFSLSMRISGAMEHLYLLNLEQSVESSRLRFRLDKLGLMCLCLCLCLCFLLQAISRVSMEILTSMERLVLGSTLSRRLLLLDGSWIMRKKIRFRWLSQCLSDQF